MKDFGAYLVEREGAMWRLGSFIVSKGVLVCTALMFLLSSFLSYVGWQQGIGCAQSLDPPRILTEEELETARGSAMRTSSWSWFYSPASSIGSYQDYPFYKRFTVGWPFTYSERTSSAEGCFEPWVIDTEFYVGGFLVDCATSVGLGVLLYWLLRRGVSRLGNRRR